MLKWQDYFDKVIFINKLEEEQHNQYQQKTIEELKRIGISDSLIQQFDFVSDNLDYSFAKYLKITNQDLKDILLEDIYNFIITYKVIEKVYEQGYKNVLFLSNNFKIKDNIEQIVQNLPPKGDLILLNKNIKYEYKKKVNKFFFKISKFPFSKSFILTRKGMRNILNFDFKDFTKCINNLNTYSTVDNVVEENVVQIKNINYNKPLYLINYNQEPINYNDPITPTTINICLSVTTNLIDKLYPLLYSLLKYSESKFNVYIILDKHDIEEYYSLFEPFQNERIKITLFDSMMLDYHFNENLNHWKTKMSYIKLLIPTLFSHLDRILYLDYDTVIINKGIEWLYNLDFKDNYLAAVEEYFDVFSFGEFNYSKEYNIFKHISNFCFNTGVILFNIPKLIQDGKDKEMIENINKEFNYKNIQIIQKYMREINLYAPTSHINIHTFTYCDQSLFNYIFPSNVLNINPIFNNFQNCVFNMKNLISDEYLNKWNFDNQNQVDHKTVIQHYTGNFKPWNFNFTYKNYINNESLENKHEIYDKIKKETDQYLKGFKS